MVVLSHLHNIHMQRCLASHFTTIFPLVDLKKKAEKSFISVKIILYLVVNMAKHKKMQEKGESQ